MVLIIDGYNLLKYRYKTNYISETTREQCLAWLRAYSRIKGHRLIVVFDGGDKWSNQKDENGMCAVVYTGAIESADEHIKDLLEHWKHADALVVSSDRELHEAASSCSIPSIDSELFEKIVVERLREARAVKTNIRTHSDEVISSNISHDEKMSLELLFEHVVVVPKTADIIKMHDNDVHSGTKAETKRVKTLKKMINKL